MPSTPADAYKRADCNKSTDCPMASESMETLSSEKRPISVSQLEYIVDEVEKAVQDSTDRELATTEIGKIIMNRLKSLDKVAYVRFASVYLEFEDVSAFMTELKDLVRSRDAHTPPKKPKKIKKN